MKNYFNIKEKVLTLFLIIVLVFVQVVPVLALNAETDPMIVVSDSTGAPGGTVSVTIDLKDNPGIVSMTLDMLYDDTVLTLTEVNDAGVLGSTSHKPELVNPYTLVWVNDTATTNYTVNGTIVTLVFTVADTAEKGTIVPIELTYAYDNYDIYDKDANKIKFKIDNGSVTVGEPGPNDIRDFAYITSESELTITGYKGTANNVIIGSTYTIDNAQYTVTEIAAEAFLGQETITNVVIPETVTTIGEAAFYDCIALTEVTILSRGVAIGDVALGYYYASRKEHVVEGFTINGYAGSTAEEYAATDEQIAFIAIAEECSHSGGDATCKDKAICEKCNAPYGEVNANNHKNTEIRDAVSATCNTSGYTGDTWCTDCNTKTATGEVIEATGEHVDANGKWESNDAQHFHTCGCGTKFDYTDHTGGEATCKEQAKCSACGASYGELNADNHKGTTYLVGQKESTCYEEGYTGDTYCSDCDVKIATGTTIKTNDHNPASVWSTDATHHWKNCETIGCGNLIDKAEHTGGEATCASKAVCSVCNVAYGTVNANNHKNTEIRDAVSATCNTSGYTGDTWCIDCNTKTATGKVIEATGEHVDADGKWEINETQHFHTCGCGTKFDYTDHTGGEATCKEQAKCSACGTSYGEINISNHIGETEIRDAVLSKCNAEGYTGDIYCEGCNTKLKTGEPIAKAPHNINDWIVIKEATIEETGEKTGKCTECSENFTVLVAKLVSAIPSDQVKGQEGTKLEVVEKSNINEDVHFVANEVLDDLSKSDLEKINGFIDKADETIKDKVKDKMITAIFDLKLILRETASNGDVLAEKELELEGKVKVTLPLAQNILEKYVDLTLLHIGNDGTIEIVPFDIKGGKAIFEASDFSYYTFVGTEKTVSSGDMDNEVEDSNSQYPQTGDGINLCVWAALLFVSGSCLTIYIVNKKRMKHNW